MEQHIWGSTVSSKTYQVIHMEQHISYVDTSRATHQDDKYIEHIEQHIMVLTCRHISSNTYQATHIEQHSWWWVHTHIEQHILSNTYGATLEQHSWWVSKHTYISSNTYNKYIRGASRVTHKITYHRSSSSYCVGAASVSGMFARASSDGMDCSIAGDECIYTWYALLLHRPKILMSHSGIPAAAAVVAAPLLKLWLEYCWWLYWVFFSKYRIDDVKCCLSSGENLPPLNTGSSSWSGVVASA